MKNYYMLKISSLLVLILTFGIAVFETAYALMDLGTYRPPISLNIKLHEKNSIFEVSVNEQLKSRSNNTLNGEKFTIRTGMNSEILGNKDCRAGALPIFAIGSSTTEQKLVDEGNRWVDRLNLKLDETGKYCVRNYGYGGINLMHSTDNLYFLSSLETPSAVLLMSNATDVGQLLRYGSYHNQTNHVQKTRVVYNGEVSKYKDTLLPGIMHLRSKLVKPEANEDRELLTDDLSSNEITNLTNTYLKQFKELYELISAKEIPFIYIDEPRILELSSLERSQGNAINQNYLMQGVDYSAMAILHRNFASAVRAEMKQANWGCFVDTNQLNTAEFLYDEGHLNDLGSKKLAEIIWPYLENLEYCEQR